MPPAGPSIGPIAQCLLHYLSINFTDLVWAKFGPWLRTVRPGILPSEFVVSIALKTSVLGFLAGFSTNTILTKFLIQKIDSRKAWLLIMTLCTVRLRP